MRAETRVPQVPGNGTSEPKPATYGELGDMPLEGTRWFPGGTDWLVSCFLARPQEAGREKGIFASDTETRDEACWQLLTRGWRAVQNADIQQHDVESQQFLPIG